MIVTSSQTNKIKTMKTKSSLLFALAMSAAVSVLTLNQAAAQGSLTPPGAPSPTMKSLDQIEPRTPVDATHTPGDSSDEFLITQPGSYYLTTNITAVVLKNGIKIITNNVTLDLNGFSLLGTNPADDAILVPAGYFNITVENGIIFGWSNTSSGNGISCSGNAVTLKHLTISSNSWIGIYIAGSNDLVTDNLLVGNGTSGNVGGQASIRVEGSNNRVMNNHVVGSGNFNSIGIYTASGTNNFVTANFVEGCGGSMYDYTIGGIQIIGPIVSTTSSDNITNTSPWVNFAF
jgi:hypothetical protein